MKWTCATCAPKPSEGRRRPCTACTGFREATPPEVLEERHNEWWNE